MQIRWEIELETDSGGAWYPAYEMDFVEFTDKIYYCYNLNTASSSKVVVYVFNDMGEFNIKTYDFDKTIGLPSNPHRRWRYQVESGDLLLYTGNKWLNISNEQITDQEGFQVEIPKSEYVYPNNQKFTLDNKTISFPTERTVICMKHDTKEILWKHALKGYPYTMIEQKNGCVLFGTAGKGGALYCIDIETGKIMRDVSTKGTVHYCWYENRILMSDEYGHLQLVDPFSEKQIGIVKLRNRLVGYSTMIVDKDQLYAVTFSNTKKVGTDKIPYITCFSLNAIQ